MRLLQGEQSERISEKGCHADRFASQAIEEKIEYEQAEKSFGFASAGREIKECCRLLVEFKIKPGRSRVFGHSGGQGRNVGENASELKKPPIAYALDLS